MENSVVRLTDKDRAWLRIYFEAKGNASEATRAVYGGTPGSIRVKGHKILTRLYPVIKDMGERGFLGMSYGDMTGIDFYLGDMERKAEEEQALMERFKRIRGPRSLKKLTKALISNEKERVSG